MIQKLKELLQDAQLQQKVKNATNLAEASEAIVAAGAEKGYSFTQESVGLVISDLMLEEQELSELSEAELQAVAGGRYCAETCLENQSEVRPGGGGGPTGGFPLTISCPDWLCT